MGMPMRGSETEVGKAERLAGLTSLPNILTLSRIFAVPLLVALMWDGGWLGYAFAFALYCVAGITDYLDGYLARAQGTVSKRSEERRVGKECVSTCRYRGWP